MTTPLRRRLVGSTLLSATLLLSTIGRAGPDWPEVHYMLHCQGCHLADGTGSPGKVPALRQSVARYLTVPGGREYLLRIPGVSQAPLDDAELAAVLNWVIGRFGPADALAGAAPFTASEVARHRPSRPSSRSATARVRCGVVTITVPSTTPSAGSHIRTLTIE